MKILAIADRPPSRPLREILAETKFDVIVTLGDLELSEIRYLELVTDTPKLGVYGNHCSGMYLPELGIENMHMKTFEVGGIVFGGFEGCVRYKDSPSAKMYTQEEASAMLATFPRVDVMLTHCPPFCVNDDPDDIAHTGYIGLRDYVLREKPKYLLHGHTYPTEATMVHQLGETEIVYVQQHQDSYRTLYHT
jgi:Icc-related predicted phosphoesterase